MKTSENRQFTNVDDIFAAYGIERNRSTDDAPNVDPLAQVAEQIATSVLRKFSESLEPERKKRRKSAAKNS